MIYMIYMEDCIIEIRECLKIYWKFQIHVKLGRALKEGEYRAKVFLLNLNEEEVRCFIIITIKSNSSLLRIWIESWPCYGKWAAVEGTWENKYKVTNICISDALFRWNRRNSIIILVVLLISLVTLVLH